MALSKLGRCETELCLPGTIVPVQMEQRRAQRENCGAGAFRPLTPLPKHSVTGHFVCPAPESEVAGKYSASRLLQRDRAFVCLGKRLQCQTRLGPSEAGPAGSTAQSQETAESRL